VGVGGVGLASLTGGEHPRPRGQLRRHVDDVLPVGQQPEGDVAADAVAALDRPDAVRPGAHVLAELREPGRVGGEPPTAQHGLVVGHHLDRHRPLVRVHPNDHASRLDHRRPPLLELVGCRAKEGTATSS